MTNGEAAVMEAMNWGRSGRPRRGTVVALTGAARAIEVDHRLARVDTPPVVGAVNDKRAIIFRICGDRPSSRGALITSW